MRSMPGNTRLFQVHMLKSVISLTLGRYVPGSMDSSPSERRNHDRRAGMQARVDGRQNIPIHAHRHLDHLVGVGVIHERAALRQHDS